MQNIIKVSRLLFLIFAMLTIVTVCYANPVQAKTNEKLIYQKFLRKEYKKPYSGDGGKRGLFVSLFCSLSYIHKKCYLQLRRFPLSLRRVL